MQHLAIFAVLTFIIALGRGVGAACPAAYIDLGTGCYRFTVQESINWDQAYFICQLENNGYLAEIESQQEQNNLQTYIKAVIDPSLANNWWIGGTDVLAEGIFRWMTSGNELTYTAWEDTEPNDAHSNEDCAGMGSSNSYLWLDYDCNINAFNGKIFKAICETKPIE